MKKNKASVWIHQPPRSCTRCLSFVTSFNIVIFGLSTNTEKKLDSMFKGGRP